MARFAKRMLTAAVVVLAAAVARGEFAAPPKGAAKALKVARGKPFRSGVVFVDGKYVPPPYQVERYGVVIRVNGQQVTGPVVPWEDFLKTQTGVKVSRTEETPSGGGGVTTPVPAAAEPPAEDPLADLFDDDPAPKKPVAGASVRPPPMPRKPVVTTTYALEGDFVPNEASKALLAKVNQVRTDIDYRLRRGGFVFFGSSYSRISGDATETKRLLGKLPGLMKESADEASFVAAVRAAGFVYLGEGALHDLYENRVDYLRLKERLRTIVEEEKMAALMRTAL